MNPSQKAIDVRHLSKRFRIHRRENNLKRLVIDILKGHRKKATKLQVLDDISLSVKSGEFLGIIGRNGSGKSTLLKILAGVYVPDSGAVEVNGQLTPFIELGVGFNPELTGRDNIFLNGALLGFSHREMEEMYDDIVEFAELEEFMDEKLNNYSSGMQVRLAFSIAIRVNSDILLIDEVLAVGDAKFQKKCYDLFKKFKKDGKTIVFVSHAMSQVKQFCDRVLVINSGKLIFNGNPNKAAKVYDKLNKADKDELDEIRTVAKPDFSYRKGNRKAEILSLKLDKQTYEIASKMNIELSYDAKEIQKDIYYGLSIYKSDRVQSVYAISGVIKHNKNKVVFDIPKHAFSPGKYYVSVGLTNKADDWRKPYDHMEKSYSFSVSGEDNAEFNNLGPVYMKVSVNNESN